MNNKFLFLVVLVLLASFSKAGSYQLKYRIECAKSNDLDLIHVINQIPELRTFMLPSGSEIYFSGDYFYTFPDADSRLKEVKALGFKDAFIRVFKYQKMLSEPVSKHYIKKVVAFEKRKSLKREEQKNTSLAVGAKEKKEKKYFKAYSKNEVAALKIRNEAIKKKKATLLALKVNKATKLKKDTKTTSKTKEKEENVRVVNEAPVFKILLAKTKKSEETPDLVQLLTDEVVYSYIEGAEKYFTVGSYETSKHANRRRISYKKYSSQEPEVLGLYKGKIISLKLAQELYIEFKNH
jgi:hypothetical protein